MVLTNALLNLPTYLNIPGNLKVVVDRQLGKLSQPLLDLVHVQRWSQFCDGAAAVGEEPPSLKVSRHHVPSHLDAPGEGLPPDPRHLLPVLVARVMHVYPGPAHPAGRGITLQTRVAGKLRLDTHSLPETDQKTQA